ncbi:AmmeMemoRadiSam system radical SAM enzyme [bacterium]|nr:AmmeMemoRadiSam system radical SAM enzyme [candidate division CSSED10-310 bacterium]
MKMNYANEAFTLSRRQLIKSGICAGCLLLNPALANVFAADNKIQSRPARFFTKMENKVVQCNLCFRECILADGETGRCNVRTNKEGVLHTLVYGNPGAVNIDPIEKKPFFHVLPGSMAFSIATVGCNINCKFCQNWQIAHAKPGSIDTRKLLPEDLIKEVSNSHCPVLAFTYSEPTVWSEYVIDSATEAKKNNIASVVVSNGSWHPKALSAVIDSVSAIKVDLKSIRESYYRDICDAELKPVLNNIISIRKAGMWLELVNLMVTSLNDSENDVKDLVKWVKDNVGDDVPLHFTRFHPMYLLKNLSPTPVQRLDKAYEIAKAEGLKYVYVGNVPNHPSQNTVCPNCGATIIERKGYYILKNLIEDGKCSKCKHTIPGRWDVKEIF